MPLSSCVRKASMGKGIPAHLQYHPGGKNPLFLFPYAPYARRRFYKAKNGEIAIDPDMQQHLISIFREHGADMSIGFDSYEEKDVLVEK